MMQFEAELIQISDWRIIRLPQKISAEFPSRGMVMLEGRINGVAFTSPVEPDGAGGHWFQICDALREAADIQVGDSVTLAVEPMVEWLEPELPEDFAESLVAHGLQAYWEGLTTKARWEWVRWIRSTRSPQTRLKRIEVAMSKMESGMKRPCCFSSTQCTEMAVTKNGVLDFQL